MKNGLSRVVHTGMVLPDLCPRKALAGGVILGESCAMLGHAVEDENKAKNASPFSLKKTRGHSGSMVHDTR